MVFLVTSAFATFAYLWLIIILIGISPGIVEVWEGLLTLLFMVALVVVSYVVDRQLLCKKTPAAVKEEIDLDEAAEPLQDLADPQIYWREKSHRGKIWDRMLHEVNLQDCRN